MFSVWVPEPLRSLDGLQERVQEPQSFVDRISYLYIFLERICTALIRSQRAHNSGKFKTLLTPIKSLLAFCNPGTKKTCTWWLTG